MKLCGNVGISLMHYAMYWTREKKKKWHWSISGAADWQMETLTKNVSEQWPHVTRHIPGNDDTGGVTGLGAKLIIRLQFGRGQAIRWDELLQMSKQLHGQRTYFLPGGAFRIGYTRKSESSICQATIQWMRSRRTLTVASWHWRHLTTCCSFLLEISIIAAHTRHVTIGTPPLVACWNGGGTSFGPIGETVAPADDSINKAILIQFTVVALSHAYSEQRIFTKCWNNFPFC